MGGKAPDPLTEKQPEFIQEFIEIQDKLPGVFPTGGHHADKKLQVSG
jgi:hypothetical protein